MSPLPLSETTAAGHGRTDAAIWARKWKTSSAIALVYGGQDTTEQCTVHSG